MKILIIRLSAIGDTIHCLPVAAALKKRIPGAEITWLVEPASAPLVENNPAVDKVVVLKRKEHLRSLGKPWQWPKTLTGLADLVSGLKASHFDLCLEMQGLFKSGIWAGLSGAPLRVGFAHAREGAHVFLTDKVDVGDYFGPDRHVVDLNLGVVDYVCKKLGITGGGAGEPPPVIPVEFPLPAPPEESERRIDQLLPSGARTAVLVPGTTWATKIWDWQSWARVAQLLSSELGFQLCLAGGASESATNSGITDWVKRECPEASILDLTGRTSLLDLIALFNRVELVVGADTGPAHLAAATGKPKVVGVYGSTPTRRNGPYGQQCSTVSLDLWCQPCFEKICPLSTTACLKELTPDMVLAGIRKQLDS